MRFAMGCNDPNAGRQVLDRTSCTLDEAVRRVIKVLNTERRWREGTSLLICITFRPRNILIIVIITMAYIPRKTISLIHV